MKALVRMPPRTPRVVILLAAALLATPGLGQPHLGAVRFAQNVAVQYRCDEGKTLGVRYLNGPDNHVALMTLDGKPTLFVNVMSGSGARYVAGRYEWWTKGDDGNLRDLMAAGSAPPLFANCAAVRKRDARAR